MRVRAQVDMSSVVIQRVVSVLVSARSELYPEVYIDNAVVRSIAQCGTLEMWR